MSLSLSLILPSIVFFHPHNRSKEIILFQAWRITLSTPRFAIFSMYLRGFFRSVAARSALLIKPSKESVAFQARTFQLNGRNYGVCVIKAAVSFPADRRIGLPNPAWNKPDTPWPSQLKEVCKVEAAVRVEFDCCSNSPFLERIRLHWTSD